LLQDGDVGVGVFPECEEVMIGGPRFVRVALQGVGAAKLEMCQRSDYRVQDHPSMVDDLLEFGCRFLATVGCEVGFASQVGGLKSSNQPASYDTTGARSIPSVVLRDLYFTQTVQF
jgi:hypothetical protein